MNAIKKIISFFLVAAIAVGMMPMLIGAASAENTSYPLATLLTEGKIKPLGRTAVNPDSTGLMCEWAGSGFQVNVSGEGGTLSLGVHTNYYSTWVIQVDSEQILRQHYASGGDITVSAEIPAGDHTVTVIKDSENTSLEADYCDLQTMAFSGTIEARPADKDLVIEYIGDSYTTGMGTLGDYTPGVAWVRSEHSFTGGYAYQSAQALGADYMVAARAGIGLFDGVSAAQPDDDPEQTIADIYPYTAGFRKTGGLYDFAKQPDLIILEIGTNDGIDETDANFTSEQWKVNLGSMIDLIQEKNPDVPIVLFAAKSYKFKLMKEVADARNDDSIYCYFFNHQGNGTGNTTHMKGHPSKQDACYVAQALNSFLMEKDLVGTAVAEPAYNDYTYYVSETGDDANAGTAAAPKLSVTGVLEQAQTERTYQDGDRIVINVTGTVKMIHTNGQKLGNVPMLTEDGKQVPILIQTNNYTDTKAKVLTGHISSTTGNALAYLCNDFTFKNVIFSAAKHSTNDVWDYRLYAGYNDIVFDNVTFSHEGEGAPDWQITAGQVSNVEGYRPPEGQTTSTVTFKNGDYTNLDFACVVLNNKIAAVSPDVAYTELPNVDCKLIIEDGANMGTVYNRYGTMTYGSMEVVVKGGTIQKYIGTPDGTSSAKKTYVGDMKFTMEGGQIFGNAFSATGKHVNVDGDIVNNITGGTIEIRPEADYDTINLGIRNSGYVTNVVNNISGGMFIIITDGTTSSGGTRPTGYYLGGQAYATVKGNIENNISGGTFVPLNGEATTYGAVFFGTMSGNVQGGVYNNITGGTFDTAAASGNFYFGTQNANYYYGKIVNTIGDKNTGKGPTFAGGSVYLGSGWSAVGATATPTAMPEVSACSDTVVISNTVYAGVFEKTTYFGPSTAADTANSKYSFVLGSIETNIHGGMFMSYAYGAGNAAVYGKVTTNIYDGNLIAYCAAGRAAAIYDGVEFNIYGMEEYHDANKDNTWCFWAGSYNADIPVPQTAGRPSVKLTVAPEDPTALTLKTPVSALCNNSKSVLGDVAVQVSGGVYPEGFSIEGVTVNEALADGFVCTDTDTGVKLSYADSVTATDVGSITVLPESQATTPVIPDSYIATVTTGPLVKYATTPEELVGMVAANGNSLVTFYADIETDNALVFPYSCTVDMNGHSLYVDPAAQKNGIWVEAAGSENNVTTVMNGSITAYQVGIRMDAGPLVVKNMTIHCTTGTTIAMMDATAYDRTCTVIGSTLASGSYSQVAFNYKNKDFSNTKVFVADSTLISYKSGGTVNFSKQTGTTPGTVTLGSNVQLYTYSSSYAGSGITVDGKALTQETDASVTAIGQTFTGLNKWSTDSDAVLDADTGISYATWSEASAALSEGGNLRLLQDLTGSAVTVRQGVTLDLNGKTLDTKYFTCYGDVTDGSAGGEGLVKASKNIHIAGQASYLPIYDSADGGYRFYKYELQNLGAKAVEGDADSIKFGFRLVLANADGYGVLAATTDDTMDTFSYVNWGGLPVTISYEFQDATLRSYAQQAAADIATNGTTTKAIVLTLTGVSRLDPGTVITVQPAIETAPGVSAETGAATWTTQ